jgi:hypothetical protein
VVDNMHKLALPSLCRRCHYRLPVVESSRAISFSSLPTFYPHCQCISFRGDVIEVHDPESLSSTKSVGRSLL